MPATGAVFKGSCPRGCQIFPSLHVSDTSLHGVLCLYRILRLVTQTLLLANITVMLHWTHRLKSSKTSPVLPSSRSLIYKNIMIVWLLGVDRNILIVWLIGVDSCNCLGVVSGEDWSRGYNMLHLLKADFFPCVLLLVGCDNWMTSFLWLDLSDEF